jgi:hypothetical protein
MPDQMIPISQLSAVGLNKDYPPVALPPNAFTDALNVRFRHDSIQKMSGEKSIEWIVPSHFTEITGDAEFVFITEWANPNLGDNNTYYILVVREDATTDHVILVRGLPTDILNPEYNIIGTTGNLGKWQSTLFQGGFAIILNNGLDVPYYLLDNDSGTAFSSFSLKQLPDWDYYNTSITLIDITHDEDLGTPGYSAGELIDFTNYYLKVEVYNEDGTYRGYVDATANGTYQWSNHDALFVTTDTDSNTTLVTPQYDDSNNTALLDGQRMVVSKVSLQPIYIRANLIKSYGDILIAGALRQVDSNGATVRQLPGLIRTSNIAAPGGLPNSWNPYAAGANTADEIQLATTGLVRDMVTLQNQMMIYTDRSIHGLTKTGSVLNPFSVTNITTSYGALTLDSVIEFDGRHLVVGNNNIYLFGGHPGSIQSLADGKVRDYFFSDLNPEAFDNIFVFRNNAKDEIWIQYPSGNNEYPNKSLIFNYKNNCWTIRQMSEMRSGFIGRVANDISVWDGGDANTGPANTETPKDEFVSSFDGGDVDDVVTGSLKGDDADPFDFDSTRRYPIFCDSMHVYFGEVEDVFTLHEGGTYESRVARIELPITPEFDSERMKSLAMWVNRDSTQDIDLYVYTSGRNAPTGDNVLYTPADRKVFTVGQDYKVDINVTGRLFNYIISDKPTSSDIGSAVPWKISSLQAKIGKVGER